MCADCEEKIPADFSLESFGGFEYPDRMETDADETTIEQLEDDISTLRAALTSIEDVAGRRRDSTPWRIVSEFAREALKAVPR